MGSNYEAGSGFSLWFSQPDDVPSFTGFVPFAGWLQPDMKS
eukprot:gene7364-8577_t